MPQTDFKAYTAGFSSADLNLATILIHEKLDMKLIEMPGPSQTQVHEQGHGRGRTSQRPYFDARNRSMSLEDLVGKGLTTVEAQKRIMECVDAVFTIRHLTLHVGFDQYVEVVKDLLQQRLNAGQGDDGINTMIRSLEALPKHIVGGKAKMKAKTRAKAKAGPAKVTTKNKPKPKPKRK